MKLLYKLIVIAILLAPGVSNAQTETMYIDPSGKVGIGTTKPTATLDVNGTIAAGSNVTVNGTISASNNISTNGAISANGAISSNGDITAKGRLKDATGFVMPVGTIVAYGGNTAPEGWLLCNGQSIADAKYAELAKVVGANTTPDLKDRFIVGTGPTYNIKATGGEAKHTISVEEMPAHSHEVLGNISKKGNGEWNAGGRYNIMTGDRSSEYTLKGESGHYFVKPTGGGIAFENRPPYYALTYIIKY